MVRAPPTCSDPSSRHTNERERSSPDRMSTFAEIGSPSASRNLSQNQIIRTVTDRMGERLREVHIFGITVRSFVDEVGGGQVQDPFHTLSISHPDPAVLAGRGLHQ